MKFTFLDKLESIRPFTEKEAWGLFRLAALSEAVGWTLLIAAIGIDHYHLPLYRYAIPIAGQIHGIVFLAYFGVLLATYTSLGWSRFTFILAAGAGVPPYGTLLFELVAAHFRRKKIGESHKIVSVRGVILYKNKLLLILPSDKTDWQLPGGAIMRNETAQMALIRNLQSNFGIEAHVGKLRHIINIEGQLEFIFDITNSKDFTKLNSKNIAGNPAIDELIFMAKTDATADNILSAPQPDMIFYKPV